MTRITAVVAIFALLQTSIFHAQAPVHTPDGWDTAVTAPLGTRVRLTLLNGTRVSGLLAEARVDALVMKDNKLERGQLLSVSGSLRDPHTFDRAEISTAHAQGVEKRTSAKKRVLVSLVAVGAVIGGILLGLFAWCASENSRCGA